MILLAIDPGNEQSAWVLYDTEAKTPKDSDIVPNHLMLEQISRSPITHLAIEMVASYGMPVGRTVFDTCVWIGRFIEAWRGPFTRVYRKDVKMHICQSMRAKDSNIRQAIIDLYPASGGGATPQIGTKKAPGPLFGFAKDKWAALSVAITWADRKLPWPEDSMKAMLEGGE